ncbi:hypothetical protein BX070DRAFT_253334 [Coemansia spiralis]|nr:hypothetical protein BX070DRAFT_253334 [Coemansia spiralis]
MSKAPAPFVFNPANIQQPRSIRPLNLFSDRNSRGSHQYVPNPQASLRPAHIPKSWSRMINCSEPPEEHTVQLNLHESSCLQAQQQCIVDSESDLIMPAAKRTRREGIIDTDTPAKSSKHSATDNSIIVMDSSDSRSCASADDLAKDIVEVICTSKDNTSVNAVKDADSTASRKPESVDQSLDLEFPFDPELNCASAIAAIKETQASVLQLAHQGIQLISEMESMLTTYQSAVDHAVDAKLKQRTALAQEWQNAKSDAENLLTLVQKTIGKHCE